MRVMDTSPENMKNIILDVIKKYQSYLLKGALISVDKDKARIRILPIQE
jgi:hypothetical protein